MFQTRNVHHNAGFFHTSQNFDQRSFDVIVKCPKVLVTYDGFELFRDPPSGVGIFSRIFCNQSHFHFVHLLLIFAFTDQVRDRDHLVIQKSLGDLIKAVVTLTRFEQIAQNHRVNHSSTKRNTSLGKNNPVVFDVLANDGSGGIFKNWAKFFEDKVFV